MGFFLIILLLLIIINVIFIGILLSNLEIDIKELNFANHNESLMTVDVKKANININLYFFKLIKILKIKITEKNVFLLGRKIEWRKIYDISNKDKLWNKIRQIKNIYNKDDLKLLKPDIDKFDFKLDIGTENATMTSFLIFSISTFLTYILKQSIRKFDEKKYSYKIIPIYSSTNSYSIDLNCKIKFKLLNLLFFIKKYFEMKDSNNKITKSKLNKEYTEYGIIRWFL